MARAVGDDQSHELLVPKKPSRHDWVFDSDFMSATQVILDPDGKHVTFHPSMSRGTVGVRSNIPMLSGIHRWAVKMGAHVYGTDIMVGVCTEELDLNSATTNYCSLIGYDRHGWGLSYRGECLHDNAVVHDSPSLPFTSHQVVVLELNLYTGSLSASVDDGPMQVLVRELWPQREGVPLYPVVTSTARNSEMTLLWSCSTILRLRHMCLFGCLKMLSRRSQISELPLPDILKTEMLQCWGSCSHAQSGWRACHGCSTVSWPNFESINEWNRKSAFSVYIISQTIMQCLPHG